MEIYRTSGTCSREIIFDVDENGILTSLRFINGCSGNAQGLSKLAVGRPIDELIDALAGIKCRAGTSCPDQLARALKAYRADKTRG
ncbi:MAG: TIGR03905 family TSCPD domain-containing protein [Clostridiales bacterium]|jgi:uncharacterized protein (TIGR03905 family)|nr:TIGR03905 family TSCPD domain-containing protein [Clostridiales bacterium]